MRVRTILAATALGLALNLVVSSSNALLAFDLFELSLLLVVLLLVSAVGQPPSLSGEPWQALETNPPR